MVEIALMIEGQNGLNWPRWQRIVRAAEDLGFAGVYRSDHFTNAQPPHRDSLELWVSLTWLAGNTKRIQFGPLVSPLSIRHPAVTARMASAVDDLSGGRLVLGLGAGWQEREHHMFGFDLLDTKARFQRFEEGLRVITHLLQKEEPLNLAGEYYHMRDALIFPRPQRAGGPPILIGGNGRQLTLPLVARYADEWNGLYLTPGRFRELNAVLDGELAARGRSPHSVRRSMMTGIAIGADEAQLQDKLGNRDRGELRERGMLVGTPGEIAEQVHVLDQAGVQRVMLQWMDLDDIPGLELLAKTLEIIPQ